MSRPAGGRVVRVVLVELRRLSHIYRPRQWIGLLVGLTGCYLIYLANVSLTTSYTKPDVATSHFTFTAGCQSVDGCGDARISIYIAMPRCANPVTVFMFLAPRAGRSNAWLPPRSPVAFVTDGTGASDFHLWAGSSFDLRQLNGGYLSWFMASKQADIEQTAYYGGAQLLRKSPSGSVGSTAAVSPVAGVRGVMGVVPPGTRYLAVAYSDNLVLKRSFGTCYLQIPEGQAEGIDTSISAKPLVEFGRFAPAVGGALDTQQKTSATYQLLTERQQPSVPFGLEVDPADSTVPIATHVGGLVSWRCSPAEVTCNGGYIAVVTPAAGQKLSSDTFLLGTLLGVLAGVLAATALQFQQLPARTPH